MSSYAQTFAISAAGMSVERMRVDVAARNLANANTIQAADGSAYQPMKVVVRARTASAPALFSQYLGELSAVEGADAGLPQATLEPADVSPRQVYEPDNPFADEKGFTWYPGVDTASEMVALMTAMRAYEANVAALNTSRALALKTLDIGGGT